ncbi:MAG: tRNA (adenosine(37)-N6)-dimethylallyltransferase MiaA [Minisyncoccia bacterium]
MQSIITILGPTAIGKSKLAIELAKKFDGIIISADSRQIYKNFDIGSGKIKATEMQGIEHYMLDLKELWQDYNVAEFQRDVRQIIKDLQYPKPLPFLVGGTGLYIESILYNYNLPNIDISPILRAELSKLNKLELQNKLLELIPDHNLNNSDWNNPIRLIRAIEVNSIQSSPTLVQYNSDMYKPLLIGLTASLDDIKNNITKRVNERLEQGAIEEVQNIRSILSTKLSPQLVENKIRQLGLGTIAICDYLDKKTDYETMKEQYIRSEYQYTRRQLTWFRRMSNINWFEADAKDLIDRTSHLISDFLQ